MSEFLIRELSEGDWREYSAIRLESLSDSPDSFGSTFEKESSFEPEQWKSRLRITPPIQDAVALAAIDDSSFIGLLSCVIREVDPSSGYLYQMWVSPEYRGRGVGAALVDRVKVWAVTRNIEYLLLSVTTINTEAISLYESVGFVSDGNTEPLREGSDLHSQSMKLKL